MDKSTPEARIIWVPVRRAHRSSLITFEPENSHIWESVYPLLFICQHYLNLTEMIFLLSPFSDAVENKALQCQHL